MNTVVDMQTFLAFGYAGAVHNADMDSGEEQRETSPGRHHTSPHPQWVANMDKKDLAAAHGDAYKKMSRKNIWAFICTWCFTDVGACDTTSSERMMVSPHSRSRIECDMTIILTMHKQEQYWNAMTFIMISVSDVSFHYP